MFQSPLSPDEIRQAGRIIFEGGSIPKADWRNLSDADKFAVNDESERLEEEADENMESSISDEEVSTSGI